MLAPASCLRTVNSLYYGSGSVQLIMACLPRIAFILAEASPPPPLSLINTLTEEAEVCTRCPLCKEKCEGGRVQRKPRHQRVVSRQPESK